MRLYGVTTAGKNPDSDKVFLFTRIMKLNSFGIFKKQGMKESIKFISRTTVGSVEKGSRCSTPHEELMIHFLVSKKDFLVFYAFTGLEYPRRLAYKFLEEVRDAFDQNLGESWKEINKDNNLKVPEISKLFKKYEKADKVDNLVMANLKVEKATDIVSKNLRELLERQGELDGLVKESEDLSKKSKAFYKNSKKVNKKCCNLI